MTRHDDSQYVFSKDDIGVVPPMNLSVKEQEY